MCDILLSIKPEYVEKLFNGSKKYEFRRKRCKSQVSKIVVYATSPIMKVVGELEVKQTLEGSPIELWKQTQEYAGISEQLFFEYFKGCTVAYGYEIRHTKRYYVAKDLAEYGITTAPQSFLYLNKG